MAVLLPSAEQIAGTRADAASPVEGGWGDRGRQMDWKLKKEAFVSCLCASVCTLLAGGLARERPCQDPLHSPACAVREKMVPFLENRRAEGGPG